MLVNLPPKVATQHIVTFFGGLQRKDVRFWKIEPTVLSGAPGRDGRQLFRGSFYYVDFHSRGSPYELKCESVLSGQLLFETRIQFMFVITECRPIKVGKIPEQIELTPNAVPRQHKLRCKVV